MSCDASHGVVLASVLLACVVCCHMRLSCMSHDGTCVSPVCHMTGHASLSCMSHDGTCISPVCHMTGRVSLSCIQDSGAAGREGAGDGTG